jgi:hypothetical protein
MSRRSLAALNVDFRSTRETSDFVIDVEYRVGKYGLRISRDGYNSRGFGGKLRHVVIVHAIREIKPDYNWQSYCRESCNRGRNEPQDKYDLRLSRHLSDHMAGHPWHFCRQPKVGDVIACRQVCVDQNAVGRGAFDATGPAALDTNAVDCNNCAVRFFHETPEPRAKIEAVEKAARAEERARKPAPPTCPHCGDRRQRTKATDRGERVMCSTCKDLADRASRYSKTAETGQDEYGIDWSNRRDHARRLADEAQTELDRREGRYAAA